MGRHYAGAQVCRLVPLTTAYLRRLLVETFVQPGVVSPRAGITHKLCACTCLRTYVTDKVVLISLFQAEAEWTFPGLEPMYSRELATTVLHFNHCATVTCTLRHRDLVGGSSLIVGLPTYRPDSGSQVAVPQGEKYSALRYDLIDRPGVLGNYVPVNYHSLYDLRVHEEGFWLSLEHPKVCIICGAVETASSTQKRRDISCPEYTPDWYKYLHEASSA